MRPAHEMFVIVVITIVATTVQGAAPAVVQGTQPWNVKGDVLVLDVSSLRFQGNHPASPSITSAEECQKYCSQTSRCNAWTYCSSKDGCGSGCDQYVDAKKPLTIPLGQDVNPTVPQVDWYQRTNFSSFGPWGLTSGCTTTCSQGMDGQYVCKRTTKWPYGMCTLKVLQEPTKPEFWSQDPGEGWVSGWIRPTSECQGITPRACQSCLQSPAPTKCIACARNVLSKQKMGLLEQLTVGSLLQQDGCATCYNTTDPDKCTDCLINQKPCAACATYPMQSPYLAPQKMDVLKCIDCSNWFGANYTDACTSCGLLITTTGAVDKCISCLGRASKVACSDDTWPPTCWNPRNAASVCAACASKASSFETCVQCVEHKPYSESCYSCATLRNGSLQSKCYDCAKTAPSPTTSCSDCLDYFKDPQQVDQCYECIADPKVTAAGRQWCFGCQNWCNTYDARAKCNLCLRNDTALSSGECACR